MRTLVVGRSPDLPTLATEGLLAECGSIAGPTDNADSTANSISTSFGQESVLRNTAGSFPAHAHPGIDAFVALIYTGDP